MGDLQDTHPDWFPDEPLPMAEETPASTEEVSEEVASPAPAPALKNVNDLLASKVKAPSAAGLEKEINKAHKANPDAAAVFKAKNQTRQVRRCKSGAGSDPRKDDNRVGTCTNLVFQLFDIYREIGDERFYRLAQQAYAYAWDILPGKPKAYRKYLTDSFSFLTLPPSTRSLTPFL